MRKASPSSIRIRTPIPESASASPMGITYMWFRIRLRSRCRSRKWTTCTIFLICGPGIRSYDEAGGIPAFSEVKFSLVSNRGCFGGCSFCALTFHQGRIVQVRSHESIVKEAELLTKEPDFKGYIHDVGGPTANFRFPACKKQTKYGACPDRQCLFPKPCRNLMADHTDYIALLRKLRSLPKVKKVFIRSGIRFDYVLADKKTDFSRGACAGIMSAGS